MSFYFFRFIDILYAPKQTLYPSVYVAKKYEHKKINKSTIWNGGSIRRTTNQSADENDFSDTDVCKIRVELQQHANMATSMARQ